MAKYTSKLNLKKPEANDFYNVEDSNGNFDKIDAFASRTDNPHSVTKAQVGLGNVDNTSDKNKPISDAQASAINEAKSIGTNANIKIDSHTSSKANPHNVTVEQIGALSSGGGTITGNLNIAKTLPRVQMKDTDVERFGVFEITPEGYVGIGNWKSTSDHINLQIRPSSVGVNEAIRFTVDGTKAYLLYGEHNLPYPSQIQNGSYDGNGGTGSKNSVILTFNFNPKIVFVMGSSRTMILVSPNTKSVGIAENAATAFSANVSWGEKSVSFYSDSTSAGVMMNASSTTYNWVAIG